MAENNENTVEPKASPLEAAEPVEVPAVMGATFAERAAAREGKSSKKAVADDDAENKSVSSAESKSRRSSRK